MTRPSATTITGWVLTGLVGLFLVADATMKLLALDPVLQAGEQLGFPGAGLNRALGAVLLVSSLLALLPATAVLGSLLVTAYLGGAVAAQLRIGAPVWTHLLFGVYLGVLQWAGLYLRSPALRRIFPLRRDEG